MAEEMWGILLPPESGGGPLLASWRWLGPLDDLPVADVPLVFRCRSDAMIARADQRHKWGISSDSFACRFQWSAAKAAKEAGRG